MATAQTAFRLANSVSVVGYGPTVAKVSQRFIDLLNAPMSALRRVASGNEVKVTGKSKWELAQQLGRLDRETLEDETDQFLYAGSTALSWLRLVPEDEEIDQDDPDAHYPIRGVELERDQVVAGLHEHSEGDPFSESDRPDEITTRPKLLPLGSGTRMAATCSPSRLRSGRAT